MKVTSGYQITSRIIWAWTLPLFIAAVALGTVRVSAQSTANGGATPAAVDTSLPRSSVVENSVVKIFATVRYPDPYKPWSKQAPSDFSGSGVVIKNKRILTNAHLVLYASQVQVQANQSGNLLSATVEYVAPDIDLAVLKLDDETFFDSHKPLEWAAEVPQQESTVMVYGYPLGGTVLSITKGIVSRVEFAAYNATAGLRIQIDAAINSGNSGGPAVVGDKMIGLAYSRLTGSAQNIGYIIPCEEIQMFLDDIADGHYDGKPTMLDEVQVLGNPTLYSFLNLSNSIHGVIVTKPDDAVPNNPLKKWDVITKIADTSVDDQGMINLDNNLRVFFKYLIQKTIKDDKVPMTVIRAGKEMRINMPVLKKHPRLIPDLNGAYPSYFVYGPMVFSTATSQFLTGVAAGNQAASRLALLGVTGSPLMQRMGDKPVFENEGLVVISSPFFPHRLSKGYNNPFMEVVKTVNGVSIKNLNHLVQVLRDSKDKYITIEFYGSVAPIFVFPRAEMATATEQILLDNDIRTQGSADVMSVWNASASGAK